MSNKKTLVWAVALILIIVIIIGGVYFFAGDKNVGKYLNENPASSSVNSANAASTPSESSATNPASSGSAASSGSTGSGSNSAEKEPARVFTSGELDGLKMCLGVTGNITEDCKKNLIEYVNQSEDVIRACSLLKEARDYCIYRFVQVNPTQTTKMLCGDIFYLSLREKCMEEKI